MPDRAKYILYVQQTRLDVQGSLCTVTPKGKPCARLSARAGSALSRAESTQYVQSTRRYRHQAVQGGKLYMYIGYTNTHFKRIGTMVGDGRRWSSHTCLTVQMVLCTSTSDYENALTYKVSFARSSCREIQSIDILVPKN